MRHGRRVVEGRHNRKGPVDRGTDRKRRLFYLLHQVSRVVSKSRSSVSCSETDSTVLTLNDLIKTSILEVFAVDQ